MDGKNFVFVHYIRLLNITALAGETSDPQGQHWPAKHFLWTVYHQIWPPNVEVKCHFTLVRLSGSNLCEIVPKSFDNIKHNKRSPIKIRFTTIRLPR